MSLFRTKPINQISHQSGLIRCLTAFDLTLLGIGAIVGAGVFILTGIVAATKAGPAVILSYILASVACGFTALSYAELASSVGGSGSAYGYSYAAFGELVAWIIGWNLILEYSVAASAVAIGWSGYANTVLNSIGIHLPVALTAGPFEGGIINLPALFIMALIGYLLSRGVKNSAFVNRVIVVIKVIAIIIFLLVAVRHVNTANWANFTPFGWSGIAKGAAVIFFAYIGFDAVSTAAEEAINPQRNLPIGIIASLAVCTVLYVLVSGLLTLIVPYTTLNVSSPVADALLHLGHNTAAAVISVGALAGLTTVILVMFYGLTRIFFAMSRDGLLPPIFSEINEKTKAPGRIIMFSGIVMCAIAGLAPIDKVAELINLGTLSAFVFVCAGVVALRFTRPDLPRPFRAPLSPLVPCLGIIFCLYLMFSLPLITWMAFCIWLAVGFLIYFGYSNFHSKLGLASKMKE